MRDALCRELAQLDIAVVAAASPLAAASSWLAAIHPRPAESATDFLGRVANTFAAVWLVAPESAGIATALTRQLERCDATVLGCRSDAVALASSKSRCLARLAAVGITTVPTWPLTRAPLTEHALWVVKPDVGCGCQDMRRLSATDAAHLDVDGAIAQPWLDGLTMSLSLLVADGCCELLSINRQHIDIAASGALALAGISRCPALDPMLVGRLRLLARRIADAIPGLAGYVGVDFVLMPDGEAVVLEVNPRLTSAFVGLSDFLDRSVAGDIMAALAPRLLGPCTDLPPWSVGISAAPT